MDADWKLYVSYVTLQCHGTPTDILDAYSMVDIPETETLLFDPDFALIAASAAAIWKKPVVSSETITCIHGLINWNMMVTACNAVTRTCLFFIVMLNGWSSNILKN